MKMTSNSSRVRAGLFALAMIAGTAFVSAQQATPPSATQPATRPAPPRPPDTGGGEAQPDLPSKFDRLAEVAARLTAEAHGARSWRDKPAVQADMVIEFGGTKAFEGTITHEPRTGCVRLSRHDGVTMIFDGAKAWVSPADAQDAENAHFMVKTLPFFFAAPLKLQERGFQPRAFRTRLFNRQELDSFNLTFNPRGPTPPLELCLVFAEPKTHQVKAVAYVAAYTPSPEEGANTPRCIVYEDYMMVDQVLLAHTWRFFNWKEHVGSEGEALGSATISNVKFITPEKDAFERPAEARESAPPEPADLPASAPATQPQR